MINLHWLVGRRDSFEKAQPPLVGGYMHDQPPLAVGEEGQLWKGSTSTGGRGKKDQPQLAGGDEEQPSGTTW